MIGWKGFEAIWAKKFQVQHISLASNAVWCYFFENLFDLMIVPDVNLSQNAGFQNFTGDWDMA